MYKGTRVHSVGWKKNKTHTHVHTHTYTHNHTFLSFILILLENCCAKAICWQKWCENMLFSLENLLLCRPRDKSMHVEFMGAGGGRGCRSRLYRFYNGDKHIMLFHINQHSRARVEQKKGLNASRVYNTMNSSQGDREAERGSEEREKRWCSFVFIRPGGAAGGRSQLFNRD